MPTIDVEFEVFCSCGNGMCNNTTTRASKNRGMPQLVIEPCKICSKVERSSGYEDGYAEGVKIAECEYENSK